MVNRGPQNARDLLALQACVGNGAVDEAKLNRALGINALKKDMEVLTSAKGKHIVMVARIFLHNVKKSNPRLTHVYHLIEKADEESKRHADLVSIAREKMADLARWTAEERRLKAKLANLAAAKQGREASKRYLEKELNKMDSNLKEALADQKSFTYWMFGSRAHVWENDVKLATRKVEEYTAHKASLEHRLQRLLHGSDDEVKALQKEEEEAKGAYGETTVLLAAAVAVNKKAEDEVDGVGKSVRALEDEIKSKLDQEGCVSFEQLIRANKVLNSFADSVHKAAAESHTERSLWAEELLEIVDKAEFITDAPDAKLQARALKQFEVLLRNTSPLLDLVKEARLPLSLLPARHDALQQAAAKMEQELQPLRATSPLMLVD